MAKKGEENCTTMASLLFKGTLISFDKGCGDANCSPVSLTFAEFYGMFVKLRPNAESALQNILARI